MKKKETYYDKNPHYIDKIINLTSENDKKEIIKRAKMINLFIMALCYLVIAALILTIGTTSTNLIYKVIAAAVLLVGLMIANSIVNHKNKNQSILIKHFSSIEESRIKNGAKK